jgi:hypothetical protein
MPREAAPPPANAVSQSRQGGGAFIAGTAMRTRFAIPLYLAALAVTGLILAVAAQ